jgi:hypothetical protein
MGKSTRRDFIKKAAGLSAAVGAGVTGLAGIGAGAESAAKAGTDGRTLDALSALGAGAARAAARPRPIVISSANGMRAIDKAMQVISGGGDCLDAVIAGVNIIEEDPEDMTVGYGGLPNEDGVVELDSSVMYGPTHRAGACGSTGRGEANLINCNCVMVVEHMRGGASPEEACLRVCERIVAHNKLDRLKDADGRPNFNVKLYAISAAGEFGSAAVWQGEGKRISRFALHDGTEPRLLDCAFLYKGAPKS